ncbi:MULTISPECIES: hypothetical protein [unclassified Oleiphilus]|uniref:hypothetical protein n=1 Tax=unclassified Oleiphilus TaxID=2631174 RepID=UPI0007C26BE4|nr:MULTISPECIES: hypothetical protein [unclassified Oleiphilus]KZY42390.1 hypothetical protein A3732_16365 [Oleiphilus sp. HI0050]KZY79093.1 hypothetical protein A3741_20680 [Oleiphilus sp. HI0069]KZY79334.1 hypothetical protein A3740_07090 [Oleiphilus sp. HI0068]KZY86002.1 hypothetical protein A3743_18000 [Oleiphilus sp. HI0072]KZZ11045.1 hypothetical protein A3749_09795 [Oleiphilus sp. HI0078]KZZ21578.1 hypothetical protein A3752_00080 [Oleiphilus sp. HI0081]KZZ47379.1 hypothetical protein
MPLQDQHPPIIPHEQLAKLIGELRFDELLQQLEQFLIDGLESNKTTAKAKINGFEVKLNYRNNTVEGACQCPESDGFDFCPHCAALCLHVNRNTQQISSLAKGPDKSRVLAYLLSQDKQNLAKEFLSLLSKDSELFERYVLRASLNQGELDYSGLKSQITELTRKPEKLFSQRQVKHFFAKIERFLDELNALDHYSDADKMLKLMEHMHQRLVRLLDTIDDNSEQRSEAVTTYRALYSKLLLQLQGREETKAKRFFKLWVNDHHAILPLDIEAFLDQNITNKFISLLNKILKDKLAKKTSKATDDLKQIQREKILRYLLDSALKKNDTDKAQQMRTMIEQGRQ